ncbi:MAG: Holliday junction branch migration protein RuvA [Nitrospirae bacterium]|nr:Holliday junction branch migration protein RuvA [Candidatus Troglogloeales bacterium]
MIASINGIVTAKSLDSLIIEVGGIGYQVFIPLSTYYQLPEIKSPVSLHIHTYVREDALQLYGFFTFLEKRLFLLLMGVSGVGPKLARNILSGIEVSELLIAIQKGAVERLRLIPGVGPKMAGRLVLELKEKVLSLAEMTEVLVKTENPISDDAISALMNLGYSQREAQKAIGQILKEEACTIEALIKKALQMLSKGN